MPSEAPYDRLGRPVEDDPQQVRVPLYGGRYENAFTVAHRGVGEWRMHRALVAATNADDPLELRALSDDGVGRLVICDGDVDLTDELGLFAVVRGRSPELQGQGQVHIEDVDVDVFEVSLMLDGEAAGEEPVTLTSSRFSSPDGSESATVGMVLTSEDQRHWLHLEIDSEIWTCMWLHRCMPVYLNVRPTRFEASVPALELGE